jgi:hypothetical protein
MDGKALGGARIPDRAAKSQRPILGVHVEWFIIDAMKVALAIDHRT